MARRDPPRSRGASLSRAAVLGGLAAAAALSQAPPPRQWRVTELAFTSAARYANPMVDAGVSAVFHGPAGARIAVPGFWDGGNVWKIRFTPTAAGEWSYETVCTNARDTGLHGGSGKLAVLPAGGDNPLYRHGGFLRVSANRRHLTYSDGTPFFWLGDTWWFAPSYLVPFDPMFRILIDARKRQRYSVVQMAFWGYFELFTEAFFYQPRYWGNDQIRVWRDIDRYFRYANDAGIIPVIGTFWGSRWDFYKLRLEDLRLQWRYLVARYGAFAVSWLICGEYNAPRPENTRAARIRDILELGRFIREIDPYQRAMSAHPGFWRGQDTRDAWTEHWYDFIMLQGGHSKGLDNPPVRHYLDAYQATPRKPLLEAECKYEGIHGMRDDAVRHAAYRAIQSGSFGYTYGTQGLWFPISPKQPVPEEVSPAWGAPTPWQEALATPGGAQMQHLRACYESVAWWRLEPRPEAVATERELEEARRILAKADGAAAFVVYFPSGLDAGLKASLRGGDPAATYCATWFNPRDGKKSAPAIVRMPGGTLLLPDRPDSRDWVLIVQSGC